MYSYSCTLRCWSTPMVKVNGLGDGTEQMRDQKQTRHRVTLRIPRSPSEPRSDELTRTLDFGNTPLPFEIWISSAKPRQASLHGEQDVYYDAYECSVCGQQAVVLARACPCRPALVVYARLSSLPAHLVLARPTGRAWKCYASAANLPRLPLGSISGTRAVGHSVPWAMWEPSLPRSSPSACQARHVYSITSAPPAPACALIASTGTDAARAGETPSPFPLLRRCPSGDSECVIE